MHSQLKGSQVSEILNPTHGVRGALMKKGIQPKDHMKENKKIIKEKEAMAKEKKELSSTERNVFKLSKFQNVSSTVKANLEKAELSPDDQKLRKEFMKAGTGEYRREERKLMKQIQVSEMNEKERVNFSKKPPVPSVASTSSSTTPQQTSRKNYIAENAKAAIHSKTKTQQVEEDQTKHESYGKVPQYIVDRKRMKEEEEELNRLILEKKNSCPPGMILMPESERVETLKVLTENKDKYTKLLQTLPMICDTIGLQRRKAELEGKLLEVEDAIKIFSRTKVYIAE